MESSANTIHSWLLCFDCFNSCGVWELLGEFTTLANMKRVWLSRKFSYIFEANPPTKLAFFIQSLYAHTIGKLSPTWFLYCHWSK